MDWHKRYLQQAAWTRALRRHLFYEADLSAGKKVLEVGCGSGAVLREFETTIDLHGLDIDFGILTQAKEHAPCAALACGDALRLPYASAGFDIVFCHFLLLWVPDPLQVLREMRRVVRRGGSVLACAEPDYTSRVDEPGALVELGCLQTESLRRQGADPALGSRLAGLFVQAGIKPVETGILAEGSKLHGKESSRPTPGEREMEWQVLDSDLAGMLSPKRLSQLKEIDAKAWETGKRRLYVPVHYARGLV